MINIDDIIDNTSDIEESLINIDVDAIDSESIWDAKNMINNLSMFYYNEEFMQQHPQLKKRIDDELESMRILIKMRKADEKVHDALVKAISANNSNASLYKALTQIQGTILSVTTKMGEIVDRLNAMMKTYQLELPFDSDQESQEDENTKHTHRGSKAFIKQMLSQTNISEEPEEPDSENI